MALAPDSSRLVDVLARLVAVDTQNPPGREAEGATLLASELKGMGFAVELQHLAEGRANVIGRLDNGTGPCLAFNSHIDTVPAGTGWTSDPFRLSERNPGDEIETALNELRALLARAKRDYKVDAELVSVHSIAGPTATALDHPIVHEAMAASSRHGVTLPQPGGLAAGCDLVHFHSSGAVGIILGPGSLDVVHQPNEWVLKNDLAQAATIYRDIALSMLRP